MNDATNTDTLSAGAQEDLFYLIMERLHAELLLTQLGKVDYRRRKDAEAIIRATLTEAGMADAGPLDLTPRVYAGDILRPLIARLAAAA